MTSFHTEKCCHLVSEHETSARTCLAVFHQFLIYSTLLLVALEANKIHYFQVKKFCTTLDFLPFAPQRLPRFHIASATTTVYRSSLSKVYYY